MAQLLNAVKADASHRALSWQNKCIAPPCMLLFSRRHNQPLESKSWWGSPGIPSFSFSWLSDNMKETLVCGYIRCQGTLLLLHSFHWRALISQSSSSHRSPQREQRVLDLHPKPCGVLPNTWSCCFYPFQPCIKSPSPWIFVVRARELSISYSFSP